MQLLENFIGKSITPLADVWYIKGGNTLKVHIPFLGILHFLILPSLFRIYVFRILLILTIGWGLPILLSAQKINTIRYLSLIHI